jgi:DinB superfamily
VSAWAQDLARRFVAANDELIALLERATPEQWRQRTADEGELRPVGVIAHHVAGGHARIAQRVEAFAHARPVPPRRPELFDKRNAQHARENPEPDQRATIDLLRERGAAVATMIAGFTDVELDRMSSEDPGAPLMTTAEVIEQRQIEHLCGHLATIKTVLSPRRSENT